MTLEDVLRAPLPTRVGAGPERPFAAGRFVVSFDRRVGFAGRGLLRRVL